MGDFALAHRILMVLEKLATGTLPDEGTLTTNRGFALPAIFSAFPITRRSQLHDFRVRT